MLMEGRAPGKDRARCATTRTSEARGRQLARRVPRALAQARFASFRRPDSATRLLFAIASEDTDVPAADQRRWAAAWTGARTTTLELDGLGHLSPLLGRAAVDVALRVADWLGDSQARLREPVGARASSYSCAYAGWRGLVEKGGESGRGRRRA